MALAAADARDLALFMSDGEEEDGDAPEMPVTQSESDLHKRQPRMHQPPTQDSVSERQLRDQISEQLQPQYSSNENTVEGILEKIRPNVNDEVSVHQVIAQLLKLPSNSKIPILIELLGNLREEYAPKDAIMSIWCKLLHPKLAKRVQSAGSIPIIRSRLLESKRKQAECDLQLLQNRISLLQQEESRAWKKIVQTKDRAHEVLGIREANVKKQSQKSHLALEREQQTRWIQKKQTSLKKESVIKKKHAAIQIISKKYQDVELVKNESKRLKAEKEKQQLEEMEKAREKRELIRRQEDALKHKKEQERHHHEQKIALRYMKKVIEEERRIKDHQRRVEEMERQERELIQRLQGTQLIQQEAFGVLEKALLQTEPQVQHHLRPATALPGVHRR